VMRRPAAAILATLLLAGCGASATPVPSTPLGGGEASGTPGASPLASASPSARAAPTPTPTPTPVPTPTPTPAPITLTATTLAVHTPTHLSRMVIFVDGGTLVVCGGWNGSGTTGTILRLDPVAGTIVQAGSLATAVHDAAGAQLGDLWLVFGGGAAAPIAAAQVVDRSGAAKVVGQLPATRADHVAAAINGTVVIAGGAGTGAADPRVLATTDGVTFSAIASLPVAVRYPAAAVLDGKLYLVGGETAGGETASIQAIDPGAGTAVEVAKLPAPISHAMAFVLHGRLYVAGGRRAGVTLREIVAVDPATGKVTAAGLLPATASDGVAAVIGQAAYLVGGERDQVLDTVVALVAGG
jgi:hypothetical protein